jgi:hypothetical protein
MKKKSIYRDTKKFEKTKILERTNFAPDFKLKGVKKRVYIKDDGRYLIYYSFSK